MENITILGWDLTQFFSPERMTLLLRVVFLIFLGIPAVFLLSKLSRKYITKQLSPQRGMIAAKVIHYTGLIIVFVMILKELGFELAPLLGAAGIIGIAVSFASQTSVSNIISGVFLIVEQPFIVNDLIQIGNTVGQVLSIDILSVKLRTFDNQFVRIPNETILKSEVKTLTRFPIRRIDVQISVAYKEDIARVKDILLEEASKNPLCLQEPEPLIIFKAFGNSGIDLMLAVWAVREEFLKVKNQIHEAIKKRFDEEGIEIPFPHVSLYRGLASEPLSVEIVERDSLPDSQQHKP